MLLVVAATFLAGGCSTTGEAGGPPTVVATTTQIADFVRQVGGDRVQVASIMRPGVDAHDFEPTPADLERLRTAALVLRNGIGLEPWLDDAVEASGSKARIVTATNGVTIRGARAHNHGDEPPMTTVAKGAVEDDHDHDHDDGKAKGTAVATSTTDDHGDEDDHDHGEHDPHVWHDVRYAMVMVRNVHDALVGVDPDGAAVYTANRDRYLAELEALDREIEDAIRGLTDRRFVTNHEAFAYYGDRYGLQQIGSIIPSFDSTTELSAADVSRLVTTLRDNNVTVIFTEQSMPAKTAEVIAAEAGCRVVGGDDALYSDALGPDGSPGATYIGMMRHNTRVIVEALGGVGTRAR